MTKYLLTSIWVFAIAACATVKTERTEGPTEIDPSSVRNFVQQDSLAIKQPLPLTDLPRTEDGAFVLSAGLYEADFQSYCLQPGTPDPSAKDVYFQAPLAGKRSEIIETALKNSQDKRHLDQKNIQLLLWSIVSESDFNKLSPAVQSTARQLLTQKQIYELKGGTLGVIKDVAKAMNSAGLTNSNMQNLFNTGISSYETYERIAVLRQPSVIKRPELKKEHWHKQEDGYFVRYLPNGYQSVKIQVYVPNDVIGTTYLIFDPTSMVIFPANSNAQRLGVGTTIVDVVRKVIKIGTENAKRFPKPRTRKEETNKPPEAPKPPYRKGQ